MLIQQPRSELKSNSRAAIRDLTYLIRYGNREFVLRRPPMGPVAPTAHDMPREYKLLSVINPHYPLAPKPVLVCEDTSIIGVPAFT